MGYKLNKELCVKNIYCIIDFCQTLQSSLSKYFNLRCDYFNYYEKAICFVSPPHIFFISKLFISLIVMFQLLQSLRQSWQTLLWWLQLNSDWQSKSKVVLSQMLFGKSISPKSILSCSFSWSYYLTIKFTNFFAMQILTNFNFFLVKIIVPLPISTVITTNFIIWNI